MGINHECEAHAGILQLSLPNLRKIFNIVKFRRAYILERSLFQTTKGRSVHYYYEKNSDPNHNYIDEKGAW